MSAKDVREKWDRKYRADGVDQWPAAEVLLQNRHLLPGEGIAVDLACGFGANAFVLARQGLKTYAWDISSVAVEQIASDATKQKLDITAKVVELVPESLAEDFFDVIVVAHYLDRNLVPAMIKSLKNNGLLFYQTFIEQKVTDAGPSSKDFLLKPNELLQLFSCLQILVYREEGLVGDTEKGFRDKAMLVGRKT